ncbi:MAG: serine/threonine-protein kinase [Holophagaceae bacterium]
MHAGRFLLGRELGRGGMGRVLEAWDPVLKRSVALKLLFGRDPELLLRVLREAQNQARLDHPNICRVLEVEAEAEQPFIAMALIQGKPLGDLRLQLDARTIARIMADVAGAIHAAHKAGIVHRDLKPQNILVEALPDSGWKPFVVDFGLARDLSREDQTLSWALMGTPAFMSPQQAQGESPRPSDDIYSLGATLYSLLGGCPPHEAATLAGLISQQARQDPPLLRLRLPQVPRDLETIVAKCLEMDPGVRYATAFDLESDLRRFLAGEPILARPVSKVARLWRRMKRHRIISLTIATASLLVIVLLGWNLHTRVRARRQVEVAQRFGMEVKEIESLLRIERMLPAHNMRPVEGQVRTRLEALRRSMADLGAMAEGPGQYALGRGFLAVRDYRRALEALERAWAVGHHAPEVSALLAQVHMAMGEVDRNHGTAPSAENDGGRDAVGRGHYHQAQALHFFRMTQGQGMEFGTFTQAQLACLEGHFADCRTLCERAVREQPWRYEALVLFGDAAMDEFQFVKGHSARSFGSLRSLLREAETALSRAAILARSDVQVHRASVRAATMLALLESEGGSPSLGPILKARASCEEALRIEADHLLLEVWNGLVSREILLRLAAGEDTRRISALAIDRLKDLKSSTPNGLGVRLDHECIAFWLLGEAQWRFGKDPRPALDAALASGPWAFTHQVEAMNVLARFEGQHGRDIRDLSHQAEQVMEKLVQVDKGAYYNWTLWGETLTLKSQWEFWTGRDSMGTIRRGKTKLEEAIRIQPGSVYSYFHLPLLHAMEARLLLAQGKDPFGPVGAALRSARAGAAIRANHYRTQLALIEAHHVAGMAELQAGRDPVPHLDRARQAVLKAWSLNGTDWRIALAQSRLALTQAEVDHAAGRAVDTSLALADRSAEKGLRVKADAPELLLCRAEAARLRARWGGDSGAEAQATIFTQRAKELCPAMILPALR